MSKMSKTCNICGKGTMHGNKVSKAFNHTHRTWKPNLVPLKTMLGGETVTLKVCTRCLRNNWFEKKVRIPNSAPDTEVK